MTNKYYRCGWCGLPVDVEGNTLSKIALTKLPDYGGEVNGLCCVDQQQNYEQKYITRDMAIDAGDLSLEGQPL